jgi:hypothetical protein
MRLLKIPIATHAAERPTLGGLASGGALGRSADGVDTLTS